MRQRRHAPFRRTLHDQLTLWQGLRLPRPERQAARAERAGRLVISRTRLAVTASAY